MSGNESRRHRREENMSEERSRYKADMGRVENGAGIGRGNNGARIGKNGN